MQLKQNPSNAKTTLQMSRKIKSNKPLTVDISFTAALWQLFVAEIKQIYRLTHEILWPLVFFVMALTLFPLGINPDPHFLQQIAPGAIWIVILLALLLSIDRLFRNDWQDGTLEHYLLSIWPLNVLVSIKLLAHWLLLVLPLITIAPLGALLMHMPIAALKTLLVSLLLGTPILLLLGGIARALTLQLRQGNMLLMLIVLPLYIPVLIFATSAVDAINHGLSPNGQLAWLGVLLLLSLWLAPLATAAALRLN